VIENLHTYENSSNTWHDRLKRKFPEQEFSDYASCRIYWKYPDRESNGDLVAKETEGGDRDAPVVTDGPPENKGYYIFT
jgi:hypothetical protein